MTEDGYPPFNTQVWILINQIILQLNKKSKSENLFKFVSECSYLQFSSATNHEICRSFQNVSSWRSEVSVHILLLIVCHPLNTHFGILYESYNYIQYFLFRVHQNPAILTFGILFYRWHNVLAKRVKDKHPDWSDEDIFQVDIFAVQNLKI